jgi:hypothetical protein
MANSMQQILQPRPNQIRLLNSVLLLILYPSAKGMKYQKLTERRRVYMHVREYKRRASGPRHACEGDWSGPGYGADPEARSGTGIWHTFGSTWSGTGTSAWDVGT